MSKRVFTGAHSRAMTRQPRLTVRLGVLDTPQGHEVKVLKVGDPEPACGITRTVPSDGRKIARAAEEIRAEVAPLLGIRAEAIR